MPAGIIIRKYFLPYPRHCNTQDMEANQLFSCKVGEYCPFLGFFLLDEVVHSATDATYSNFNIDLQSVPLLSLGFIHKSRLPRWHLVKKVQESSWHRKILLRRKWQPTPVFLPGKFHRQRSLVGYSPWGHKELDMTE